MVLQKIYFLYWLFDEILRNLYSLCPAYWVLFIRLGIPLVLCRLITEYYYIYKNLEEIKQLATNSVLKQMCSHHKNIILKRKTQTLLFMRLNFLVFVRCSLLSAHCFLFFALCSKLFPCCSLLFACYLLLFARYSLRFARCSLLFAFCLLLFARSSKLFARCSLLFAQVLWAITRLLVTFVTLIYLVNWVYLHPWCYSRKWGRQVSPRFHLVVFVFCVNQKK